MSTELCSPERLRRILAECGATPGHSFWNSGDLCFGVNEVEDPTSFQADKLERVFNVAYAATHKVTVKAEDGLLKAIFAPL